MLDPKLQFNNLETSADLKSCCAAVYESDWARLLLGDSFHPGGLALTQQLGNLIDLQPGQRVLDVASGSGTSALFLAEHFGVDVVGIDYGRSAVAAANTAANDASLADQVRFEVGDAEQLPFTDNSFDALLCECAFCTFPAKTAAATEFFRVLKPRGMLGFSDLTRNGRLPTELDSLLAWITCIADAQPVETYLELLQSAGFAVNQIENHDQALFHTVAAVRGKLLGAELLLKLKKIDLPGADFQQARTVVRNAFEAIQQGKLGYILITASSPSDNNSFPQLLLS